MQARRLWENTASEEALGQLNRSSPNRKNTIFDSAQSAVGAYIGNESMPKIIINNTIDLFFLICDQHFANCRPQFPSAV